MTLPRTCCCSQPTCTGTCEFASSYQVTGLAGSIDYEWYYKPNYTLCADSPCPLDCDIKRAWSFTASFVQLAPMTLSRVSSVDIPGACCYQATGTMRVTWTLARRESIKYCVTNSPTCTIDDTWSGVTDVTCCYQVSCGTHAWNSGKGWVHQFNMCSFEVHDVEIMVQDCTGISEIDCPVSRDKIIAGGLSTSWTSKFGALTSLDPDITWNGWCDVQTSNCNYTKPGTDPSGDGVGCMPTMFTQSTTYGPMSLYTANVDDIFTECTTPGQLWISSRNSCDEIGSSNDSCLGDWEYNGLCCSNRFNGGMARATFS